MRFLQKLFGNIVKLVSEIREIGVVFLRYFVCLS